MFLIMLRPLLLLSVSWSVWSTEVRSLWTGWTIRAAWRTQIPPPAPPCWSCRAWRGAAGSPTCFMLLDRPRVTATGRLLTRGVSRWIQRSLNLVFNGLFVFQMCRLQQPRGRRGGVVGVYCHFICPSLLFTFVGLGYLGGQCRRCIFLRLQDRVQHVSGRGPGFF